MRRITGALLALLTLLAAALAAPQRYLPAASAAELTSFQAVSADAVVDAYGVGIHLAFLDTPYRDATAVADALSDLGVRHVRDDLYLDNPRQYAGIAEVAQRGVGFDLIMGRPGTGATPKDYVDTVATQLPPGAVESVEGVNEWDLFGGGENWVTQLVTWQQLLYTETKANPATAHLPVLSPALAFRWNYAALPDLSPWADKANAHMYPGGYPPANEVTRITSAVRSVVPSKPLITTEAGYHNAVNTTNGHRPVPEDVAGVYLPRLLLEHFQRGEERVYSYELIDEFEDPERTNPEAHFGLLRRDLSPKPAYTAMKSLLGLLADPGPAFTPGSLEIAVDGWPSDGRYLLTQKRDGRFVLLLWRDVSVYDPVLQVPLPVTPTNVTLRLARNHHLAVHRPSEGADPVAQARASSIPLQLDGSVTAVTIDPAPAPAPTNLATAPGDGSATLSWELPATEAPVTGFEIVRHPDGTSTRVDGFTRSFQDTGLTNGATYSYTVRTLSPDGDSGPVTSPEVVPATVPSAPVITSTSAGKGSVTLAWRKPAGNGRPVLGYELSGGGRTLQVGPDTLKATLTGLPRRTRLRVALRARNEMGWSPVAWSAYVRTS